MSLAPVSNYNINSSNFNLQLKSNSSTNIVGKNKEKSNKEEKTSQNVFITGFMAIALICLSEIIAYKISK